MSQMEKIEENKEELLKKAAFKSKFLGYGIASALLAQMGIIGVGTY